jgi:hypothetical protein
MSVRVKGISPSVAAGLLAIVCGGTPALAQNAPAQSGSASPGPEAFIKRWDRSGKDLLGLSEIEDAAIVKFEVLDTGHKGRLTEQDLAGALAPQEFSAANPDRDNTIGAEEWFKQPWPPAPADGGAWSLQRTTGRINPCAERRSFDAMALSVRAPNRRPIVAHMTACMPSDAMRNRQSNTAGNPSGTSFIAGSRKSATTTTTR